MVPPKYVRVFVSLLSPDIKESTTLYKLSKKLIFFGVHLGVSGGLVPPSYVKIVLYFKFQLTPKKTSVFAYGVKKVIFGASL